MPCDSQVRAWIAVAALAAAGATSAGATTYTITTTADDAIDNGNCTLREAIRAVLFNVVVDACAAGEADDTIVLPDGTYPFGGEELLLGLGTLEIRSENLDPTTAIVDLGHSGRFLNLQTGIVTLRGFTIRNGTSSDEGGAIIASHPALTLDRMRFSSNSSAKSGGAVSFVDVAGDGSLWITGSSFDGNSAIGLGGALAITVQNSGVFAALRDVEFYNNSVSDGATSNDAWGGGLFLDTSFGATSSCVRCVFLGNTATTSNGLGIGAAQGAGASLLGGPTMISDARFVGNSTSGASDFDQTNAIWAFSQSPAWYVWLDRVVVSASVHLGAGESYDVGLGASGTGAVYLTNSLLSGGTRHGVSASTQSSGTVILDQVTIAGYPAGTGAVMEGLSGSILLQNSLLALNATDYSTAGAVGLQNNCIAMGLNFPNFVNAAGGNYHLTGTSAAIDVAVWGGISGHFDLDHGPRVFGPNPDCGAYEYGSLFADDLESGETGNWSVALGLSNP